MIPSQEFKEIFYSTKVEYGWDIKEIDAKWDEGIEYFRKVENYILSASNACWENGNQMFEDARVLFDNCKFARSTSLSILASEEVSKATILKNAHMERFLSKSDYAALCGHPKKHINSNVIFYVLTDRGHISPDKKYIVSPKELNKAKNSGLYVLCKKNLKINSSPQEIDKEIALEHIHRTQELIKWVSLMFNL